MARLLIGLSGYSYKPWQGPGRFYPIGLKPTEFLSYYATRYETVELDGIWYRMPSEATVRTWIASTPSHFLFAPKVHRQITHIHRLKPEALSVVHVMLDRLAPLRERGRLGPLLLQLPPNLHRDDDRLGNFLAQLPRQVRWAMEFRHPSWNAAEVEELLRRYSVAWALVETDERQRERRNTASFWYTRLRRSEYSEKALAEWAGWLKKELDKGHDCFVFFKHEDEGSPWVFADRLIELCSERKYFSNPA